MPPNEAGRMEMGMKTFMDEDFLLSTPTAKVLYHHYAEGMPILDYHCHISPREIYEDQRFDNITQVWLGRDHYKWRLMRANGVDENDITGDAPDWEKFLRWAETLPLAIGNPLYHWSHLELKRYFGYEGCLNGDTARQVWDLCHQKLAQPSMSARGMIRMSNVRLICTTDDPVDSLEWHQKIARDETFDVRVLPTWRPDLALGLERADYPAYLEKLSEVAGICIDTFEDLLCALEKRMNFFAENGCRVSDHGLPRIMYAPVAPEQIEAIFKKRLSGGRVTETESEQFKTALMIAMGRSYSRRGWVMQLHYGVQRDLNRKIFKRCGPDAGIDAINSGSSAVALGRYLNALAETDELPRTILYSLDPADNAVIDTVMGCFQDSSAIGKIQHGSAWWFNDNIEGMRSQMISMANQGLLGNFIGMLTDSRSFLSYARHEYFRRVMCDLIGTWVENGEYPNDEKMLKKIVEGISYRNAERYFGF